MCLSLLRSAEAHVRLCRLVFARKRPRVEDITDPSGETTDKTDKNLHFAIKKNVMETTQIGKTFQIWQKVFDTSMKSFYLSV